MSRSLSRWSPRIALALTGLTFALMGSDCSIALPVFAPPIVNPPVVVADPILAIDATIFPLNPDGFVDFVDITLVNETDSNIQPILNGVDFGGVLPPFATVPLTTSCFPDDILTFDADDLDFGNPSINTIDLFEGPGQDFFCGDELEIHFFYE